MTSVQQYLLVMLLFTGTTLSARVSQSLVGGHVKAENPKTNKNEEAPEEKKTLSQQVAEGKYGLIQTEIFEKPPERLGVLSYEKNLDVPKDNVNSLGGLGPEEIWLAEDHLLVLKGGAFHRTASEMPWPPIDNYKAPNRQVKIPSQPKVPPPFPVQLSEGGPLELLGFNITGTANGSLAISGPDGAPPFILPPPYSDPANTSAGRPPFALPPFPATPPPENFNRGDGPGPFPFPPYPNLNQSLDEDDPSIYYPPPYSFFYPTDNSSKVPPGPLVPGIVLPPPPDFFGPLDPITTTSTTTTTTPEPPRHAPTPRPVIHVEAPPIHYLPYDISPERKRPLKPTINIPVKSITIKPNIFNLQEVPYHENELANTKSTTLSPIKPTVHTVPVINIPYHENIEHPKQSFTTPSPIRDSPNFAIYNRDNHHPRTQLKPTSPSTTTPSVYFHEQFNKNENQPSRVIMPPFEPTLSPISVIQVPRTYLRPTTAGPIASNSVSDIPIVQVSYGGNDQRPRTYLKPTSGAQSISNTVSPVPVLQVPYNDQRPRTYLKPTTRPQNIQSPSPISIQYLPYNNHKNRVKPTAVPTVSTVPVLRVPYERAPHRAQVSSTAVPLKGYFSSVDVDTNSVQPHAEYYFYEEERTPAPEPQRFRYVAPSNFQKHIQQLRQQIQSYLKPSAKPVYEYSFQAANYRPTKPPTRYLTPAPPQQFINHRPTPSRYQQESPNHAYYSKQDERLFDDITKKYFTVFGQKITTPVTPPLSLASDTLVNYREPQPQINPHAEYVNIPHQQKQQPGGPGTFISYELPGEGAHFYFLTPQLVQQQQQQQQTQQKAYYYEKPDDSRIPRRNHR